MSDIDEKEFADRIGVVRQVLSKLRSEHLTENSDFVKKGGRVLLTEHGAQKAAQLLSVSTPSSEEAPAPERFWVFKVPVNPRVVVVSRTDPERWKKEGAGEQVLVRVHSNVNFVPRMELKARPSERAQVYVLVGRSPRWKGRY